MSGGRGPASAVDTGYPHLDLRWRNGVALRLPLRAVLVNVTSGVAALLFATVSLEVGDFTLEPSAVFDVLAGAGSAAERMVVLEWRMPIALAALLFGALLGVAGAVFQSLTRTPLGSPDVIGFDAGSYTAVIVAMLLFGVTGYWLIAGAAVAGGLLTALAVWLLSYRRGMHGFRLIIVGIGASALLGSVNSYLITQADQSDLVAAGFWGAGSLSRTDWSNLAPALVAGIVVLVLLCVFSRPLRQLELGDDAARSHGISADRTRVVLLALGVAASAVVTAAAGPIGFVALAAPQIGRRVSRSPGISLVSAACAGAFLLSAAQLLSAALDVWYRSVPVGL
ncbi:MAG: iron chelate uptake ABC transporter family permease subunit, partial [Microbacterium sp.]